MQYINFNWVMIGLDCLMIIYTLWVLSLNNQNKFHVGIGLGLFSWLFLLHLGLSNKILFTENISGISFLAIIFAAVGFVGALLFLIPSLRKTILLLDQKQLLLLQGIRVFFGASFLMQASLGAMPLIFGIIDGLTHISAGFFGLIAAFTLSKGLNGERRAWFANIFGLLDILIVASSLSLIILDDITPHGSMMYAVFLPAPLWLWAHAISIYKLINNHQPTKQNGDNLCQA